MNKKPILLIIFFLIIGIVSAFPNFDYWINPFTGLYDMFVDVTDLGSNLNLSGYNVTADRYIGNGSLLTGILNLITFDNDTIVRDKDLNNGTIIRNWNGSWVEISVGNWSRELGNYVNYTSLANDTIIRGNNITWLVISLDNFTIIRSYNTTWLQNTTNALLGNATIIRIEDLDNNTIIRIYNGSWVVDSVGNWSNDTKDYVNYTWLDNATIVRDKDLNNETIIRVGNGTWVRNLTASVIHLATNISVISGTLDAGNVTSVHVAEDGLTYDVTEASGASPLIIQINFTNITIFDSVIGRIKYAGGVGHEVQLEIWSTDLMDWENYLEFTDMNDFINFYVPVFDSEEHINITNVTIRFNHEQSGIPSHQFFIDYIALVEGFTTSTVREHDALGGRDDISNHPWAFDTGATRTIEGNVTANGSWVNFTGTLYANLYGLWNRSFDIPFNQSILDIADLFNSSFNQSIWDIVSNSSYAYIVDVQSWIANMNTNITNANDSMRLHIRDNYFNISQLDNWTIIRNNSIPTCSGTDKLTYNGTDFNCSVDISLAGDTNESVRFNNLVGTNCSAGDYVRGHLADGTVSCDTPAGEAADGVGYNSSTINLSIFRDNNGDLDMNISWEIPNATHSDTCSIANDYSITTDVLSWVANVNTNITEANDSLVEFVGFTNASMYDYVGVTNASLLKFIMDNYYNKSFSYNRTELYNISEIDLNFTYYYTIDLLDANFSLYYTIALLDANFTSERGVVDANFSSHEAEAHGNTTQEMWDAVATNETFLEKTGGVVTGTINSSDINVSANRILFGDVAINGTANCIGITGKGRICWG